VKFVIKVIVIMPACCMSLFLWVNNYKHSDSVIFSDCSWQT